jgi:hypothetical protein
MVKERTCGDCDVCCGGWLTGSVNGKEFFAQQPCYYKGKVGCTIYEDRPHFPCRVFKCEWLTNEVYPEWMKPNISGSLIVGKEHIDDYGVGHPFLLVFETDIPISTEVLLFLMLQYFTTKIPVKIQMHGCWHWFGPPDWEVATSMG